MRNADLPLTLWHHENADLEITTRYTPGGFVLPTLKYRTEVRRNGRLVGLYHADSYWKSERIDSGLRPSPDWGGNWDLDREKWLQPRQEELQEVLSK